LYTDLTNISLIGFEIIKVTAIRKINIGISFFFFINIMINEKKITPRNAAFEPEMYNAIVEIIIKENSWSLNISIKL
jgi:hypothetical protein